MKKYCEEGQQRLDWRTAGREQEYMTILDRMTAEYWTGGQRNEQKDTTIIGRMTAEYYKRGQVDNGRSNLGQDKGKMLYRTKGHGQRTKNIGQKDSRIYDGKRTKQYQILDRITAEY
jgi:hypothetical protein